MEFCDGGDLSCLIKRKGKLSEKSAQRLLKQLGKVYVFLELMKCGCSINRPLNKIDLEAKGILRIQLGESGILRF